MNSHNNEKIKYFSTFTGIGGFELGIGNKGECVGYSEIDKYAIQIYEKHFNHKNYGDITKIDEVSLPDFELLVGGFPCQSFSIAGKRDGFRDTRGTLFFDIARIVKEKQPRLLLLENVKGLLSHNKGSTFYTIISTLDELGYDIQWQVLNSKNQGVPQNRERMFIIGHLRGTSRPEVFPFGSGDNKFVDKADEQGCANTLTGRSAGGQNRRGNYIIVIKNSYYDTDRLYSVEGIARTIRANAGGKGAKTGLYEVSNILKNLEANNLEITEKGVKSLLKAYGLKIRRLTPTECERVQGFPDGWTEEGVMYVPFHEVGRGISQNYKVVEISDTQRYKALGNAVTVNVVKAVMKKLI